MKKAVFIIPYFGKLPANFELWEKTAAINRNFDFWIFTDDSRYVSKTQNVQITNIPFSDFVEMVQEKFDFPIALTTPRKLCDFRPAYGLLFEERITEYSYWGYCDMDVILGNLDRTIPIMDDYDKLFVHGHMTLVKNTPELNRLFQQPVPGFESYQDILQDENNHVFDETSNGLNLNLLMRYYDKNVYFDYQIADIKPFSFLFHRSLYEYGAALKQERTPKSEDIVRQIYLWRDGKLLRYALNGGQELIVEEMRYFHFQKRVLQIQVSPDCSSFLIYANRVIPFDGEVTMETVKQYTHGCLIYPQYFKLKWQNLKKKLKR